MSPSAQHFQSSDLKDKSVTSVISALNDYFHVEKVLFINHRLIKHDRCTLPLRVACISPPQCLMTAVYGLFDGFFARDIAQSGKENISASQSQNR